MTLTLSLRGTPVDASKLLDDDAQLQLTSHIKLRLGAQRDLTANTQKIQAAPDDAVCLRLTDGFEWWLRADEAAREFGVGKQGDRDEQGNIEIDPVAALQAAAARAGRTGGRRRDGVDIVLDSLEVVGIDLAGKSAEDIGEWAENKALHPEGPGLYRVSLGGPGMALKRVETVDDEAAGPVLVFIHGTGSSSEGSFSELWEDKNEAGKLARKQLADHYGKRVYALEHRTLTESPINNALDLANHLPQGAEVHLVTHSRGGLVGDLLCLGQRESGVLTGEVMDKLFAEDRTLAEQWGLGQRNADGYPAQRRKMDELLAVLDTKRPQVKRYVRTACPALGTTLASGRLDRWLSVLRFVGAGPIAQALMSFLLAVIKERTDPRSLPGLEAMMPGSALVRLLNLEALRVDADLSVIAGDIEGGSIWGRIKLALPDWFFAGDHDLVVNTGSMYGGARRKEPARYFFDQGPEVSHFNYFRNARTVRQVAAGLIDPDTSPADFKPLHEALRKQPARALPKTRKPAGSMPIAIVLPGIMGSHLSEGGERVWFDLGRMANGGIERLRIERPGVTANEVFERFYGDFTDFLQDSHTVKVFPYDWRISVRESANALAALVEQCLDEVERSHQGLHIVAHSMGGLVARAMLAQRPDLLARLRSLLKPGCFRLLMLGTPNHGSFQAVRLMVGQYHIANQLALLDFRHSRDDLLKIFNCYPGAAELLPWAEGGRNFADPAHWQELHEKDGKRWPLPDATALRAAQQTWKLLRDAPADGDYMSYIAGWAGRTACDYHIEQDDGLFSNFGQHIAFLSTGRGDGTVPWDLGRLSGVPTWYAEGVEHDQLLAHRPAFPAYLDLLFTGRTDRLSSAEPADVRGLAPVDDLRPMPADIPPYYPTEANFGGFGSAGSWSSNATEASAQPLVKVSIRHGDLAYARYPVCVGHYQGDTQVSAERRLDTALDGALADRLRLDIYPGRLGTWEIFIAPSEFSKPAGALVIGLGQIGHLSPGALSSAISRVLLDYALQVANWQHDERFGATGTIRKARISSLLIGTGAGGFTVRDSVTAILLAVNTANARLAQLPQPTRVWIDELELLDIYEDIAVQAAHALAEALEAGDLTNHFIWPEHQVKSGESGLRRGFVDEAPGWWRRLEISHERERDQLHFVMLTDRARAEHSLVAGQIKLADNFIDDITATTTSDGDLSRTLYEMLLPNPLKELAPERRDTVLLVDEESARFPWEMLDDRWTDAGPLSIAAGLLRQLKTREYRAKPLQTQATSAFVVGNPQAGVGSELPGARTEAQAVVRALRADGYRVREAIDADSGEIMRGLHADAYRILHLAGHGVHDYLIEDDALPRACEECKQTLPTPTKRRSGMLIGPSTVLTPGDIEQIRWVPELVFINCCHLGATQTMGETSYGKLAANLAVQFIRMGVKAVIAAGWAVDDAAARAFAVTFYGAMTRGVPFGRAVQEARQHIYRTHPQCNTWGAYQCYGDPDYRLIQDGDSDNDERAPYYSPQELVTDLNNLASSANIQEVDEGTIERLLARIAPEYKHKWLKRADVATALGLLWGQMGHFDQALACLDNAVQDEKSTVPLRALEQRANYRARQAATLAREGEQAEAKVLFATAKRELEMLLALAPTVERHNLMGSFWKRHAMSIPEERLKALQAMEEHYTEAAKLCAEADDHDDAYPKSNALLAKVLIGMLNDSLSKKMSAEISKKCREIATQCHRHNQINPKFWTAVAEPDALLVAALADNKLAEKKDDLLNLYRHAIERGASRREAASVKDQYICIGNILADCPDTQSKRAILLEIENEIENMRKNMGRGNIDSTTIAKPIVYY